jgi:hypothetical protein
MSVVGVDFGTLNTVIAVARNRGVDVVCIFSWRAKNCYMLIRCRSQMRFPIVLHRK